MNRRELLRAGGIGAVVGIGGCLSTRPRERDETPTQTARERCSDRKFPERHLGVAGLRPAGRPAATASIIRYGELPAGEQRLLDRAIERGRVAVCLPNAGAERADHFGSLVRRVRDRSTATTAGAYLQRDGSYYRFTHVRSRDQVFVTATASSGNTERAAWGDPVTLGDATLTLSRPRIRKAIAEDFGLWQEVRCEDGQSLLAEATTEGAVPTRLEDIDLSSVVNGETTVEDVSLVVEGRPGDAPRNPSKWNDRLLAWYFPDEPVEQAAIRWKSGEKAAEWTINAERRERLVVEPAFELERFEVSTDGNDVRVDIRVGNSGARAGEWLGQFSFEAVEDDSSVLPLSVPEGETAEFGGVPPVLSGVATDGRTVTLAYPGVDDVIRVSRTL